ncbi:MAG: sodium/proline symporter [Myxococcota bacterium]|nr:sodium/proline symporter [Myxococcota bacterium]
MIASFAVCMLGFAAIGAASLRVRRTTSDDYLLAGRDVPPWLAALSAVATNNSGYMFIGQIGLTYAIGVQSLWLAVGWIVGDALVWWRVHRRIREISEEEDARSVPSLLGGRSRSRAIVVVTAVLVLVFLGTYAAAQLQAGAKALHAVLGWDQWIGVVIGAAIVLLYSYAGGLRASIWTDAAQSFVMIAAMGALLAWSIARIGGFGALSDSLVAIEPSLVDPLASEAPWGFAPWALGWIGGGLGVLGQPTILARTMSLRKASDVPRAGVIYFSWFIPFYVATILLGLCARVLVPELADPELAMPTLADRVLPELLVGTMLAGVFAATMSTADSQILACSAAITEDLMPRRERPYFVNKLATAAVASMALGIALWADEGVFVLVLYAWAALAVTLGPLVVVRALDRPLPPRVALAMMGMGFATMLAWRAAGLDAAMYEILPGMLAAALTYGVAALLGAVLKHEKVEHPVRAARREAVALAENR